MDFGPLCAVAHQHRVIRRCTFHSRGAESHSAVSVPTGTTKMSDDVAWISTSAHQPHDRQRVYARVGRPAEEGHVLRSSHGSMGRFEHRLRLRVLHGMGSVRSEYGRTATGCEPLSEGVPAPSAAVALRAVVDPVAGLDIVRPVFAHTGRASSIAEARFLLPTGMTALKFEADFFALPDGTVRVLVRRHWPSADDVVEVLGRSERRGPRSVGRTELAAS